MTIYERISVVVSITLIGLALYFVLEFPTQMVTLNLFGTPLSIIAPRQWLMAILLAGLAMAGTDTVVRTHPNLPDRRLSYLASFWMLPGLLVILATQTLGLAPTPLLWGLSLVGVGILLWLTIIAEYHQVNVGFSTSRWAYLWRKLMGYGLALGLFVIIYYTRSRSILSASTVLIISSMLALALLRRDAETVSKTWLYAAVIGLIMGQITWAFNYWQSSTLSVGLLLLLIFYVLTGLAQQQLWHNLSRRTVWEFGAVTATALIVIFTTF